MQAGYNQATFREEKKKKHLFIEQIGIDTINLNIIS